MTRTFKTGARPTPRYQLASARPHMVLSVPPPQVAYIPKKLDMWGNDDYGDCVTAEEAFAKACYSPEVFLTANQVVAWAQQYGFRDGANILDVLKQMKQKGFTIGNQQYDDGGYSGVDYSNETVLQSAIAQGPVKIGLDANALPDTAGNQQGWYAIGGKAGQYANEDHCTSLCGYGPTGWLFLQLGVQLPTGLPAAGYLFYTWSTIGFVDHAWLMSTVGEAWVRNPTTVGVPPLPGPAPTPTPVPTPTPTPTPAGDTLTLTDSLVSGKAYSLPGVGVLVATQAVIPGVYHFGSPAPSGVAMTPADLAALNDQIAALSKTLSAINGEQR